MRGPKKKRVRQARWAAAAVLGALAASGSLPGCGGVERFGGLMLEMDGDPELNVDLVSVAVTTDTRVLEPVEYVLEDGDFPATLGVMTSGDDALVRLHIVAFSEGVPVDVRDLKVEHIPRDDVKLVRVYFSTACTLLVSVEEEEPATTCSAGKTCDPETASCVSGTLDARDLPTFEEDSSGSGGGPSGSGGGSGQGTVDLACAQREPGDTFCSAGQRYRCGDDLLLSQTTPDPCELGERCSESSGKAECTGGCAENNGGCAEGVACVNTAEGPKCSGCGEDELSPSGDGTDCVPRTNCEPGSFVSDPGSAAVDRACSPCEEGSFSTASNASECSAWQSCQGAFVEKDPGTLTEDRVCIDSGIRHLSSGGTDEVYTVARSPSGILCTAGHVDGTLPGGTRAGGEDAFVACFDPFGQLLWLDQFGSPSNETVTQVIFDGAENVIVGGVTEGELASESMGGEDAFVRKYSPSGKVLWSKQWGTRGDDGVYGVAVTTGSAIIAVGVRGGGYSGGRASDQVAVTALSESGVELWSEQFGPDGNSRALGVASDDIGGFFVVGSANGRIGNIGSYQGESTFVRRYQPSAGEAWEVAWTDQFGSGSSTIGRAVAYDSPRERLVIVGETNGALGEGLVPNSAGVDIFARSYLAHELEFTVRLGSAAADEGNAVGIDADHSIWVAADVRGDLGVGHSGGPDVLLAHLTEAGELDSLQTFGTGSSDLVNGLAIAPEGIWLAIDTKGNLEGVGGTNEATAAFLLLAPRTPN